MNRYQTVVSIFALWFCTSIAHAQEIYPAAIFDFVEKDSSLKGLGEKVSTLVFAELVKSTDILLVERNEMQQILNEAALNLSGMVDTGQANQIGQLTGAKIIITGTLFEVEDQLVMVAKIIGAETSRVSGVSVKGPINDPLPPLVSEFAREIEQSIRGNAKKLVAQPLVREDLLANLKQEVSGKHLPSLSIAIQERHISRASIDPAAETEMLYFASESGFSIVQAGTGQAKRADYLISGEGFTESSMRQGDILGVKARLEVKVIDQKTQQVLAVDRQTEVQVDVSEMIAAKAALAQASAKIAARLLPKLANAR